MVAAKILELQPQRVAGLLGVSCVVPAPGASFIGSMPFPNRAVLGLVMRVLGTRPPEKALRAQAAGLPAPVVEALVSDFVPESQRYYRDPAQEAVTPTHRGYVCTTRDDELPESPPALVRLGAWGSTARTSWRRATFRCWRTPTHWLERSTPSWRAWPVPVAG